MKKRIISLVLLGISVLTVTACAALQAQSQRMAEKIIRLHVVANSDSDVDQAVKLRVRDAVLREAQNVLSDASDAKQAIAAQLLTETLSEEMRLLYVAMTRAKERLVITGTVRDIGKTVSTLTATAMPSDLCVITHASSPFSCCV